MTEDRQTEGKDRAVTDTHHGSAPNSEVNNQWTGADSGPVNDGTTSSLGVTLVVRCASLCHHNGLLFLLFCPCPIPCILTLLAFIRVTIAAQL